MKKRNKKTILLSLVFLNVLAWSVVYSLVRVYPLRVDFFDIGQGDSIFIQTPKNYQILIDGGPTDAVLEKLGENMDFWDKSIDLIVLTHADHDHLSGLIEVLKRYQVDYVLWNGLLKETGENNEWKRLIENGGFKEEIGFSGKKIKTSQVYFDILYPFEELKREEVKDFNSSSIVLRLVFGNNSFLFTGDITSSDEKDIIEKGLYIQSNVLKVAHHGSKTSSSDDFIRLVSPEIGVISAGRDNRYNHPAPEILEVLGKYDISILRTDLNGDIEIISNGENIKIN